MVVLQFVLVRLIINRVDTDNYGIWLTMYSFLAWVNLLDLGISQGFRNMITKFTLEGRDFNLIVRTFMFANLGIALMLLAVYFFIGIFLDYSVFIGSLDMDILDLFAILVSIQFITRGINTVYHGRVMSHIVDLIQFVSFLGVLLLYYIVTILAIEINIKVLIYLYLIPPIIAQSVAWVFFSRGNRISLIGNINKALLVNVIGDSSRLFVAQLVAVAMYSTVNIVILNFVGSEAVVEFGLSYRIFSIFLIVNSIAMSPLWSHAAVLWRSKEKLRIRLLLKKLLSIWVALALVLFFISFYTNEILLFWTSKSYSVSRSNVMSISCYVVIMMLLGIYSNILNGVGDFKYQMRLGLVQLFSLILLTLLFRSWLTEIWNYFFLLDLVMLAGVACLFLRIRKILSYDF